MTGLLVACGCGPEVGASSDSGPATRLVLETIDSTACEDWAVATHPAPDLPLDAPTVPTILWEWSPLDDPMLTGVGPGFDGYELRLFSISATGEIWLRAPTETDVTALSREGRALFHVRIGDPLEHGSELSIPVAAPDGTVFVCGHGPSDFVMQYSSSRLIGRAEMTPSAFIPVIGPGGRMYLGATERCRLRAMRTLYVEQTAPDGTVESHGFGGAWVEPLGAVVGNGFGLASRPVFELDGTPLCQTSCRLLIARDVARA